MSRRTERVNELVRERLSEHLLLHLKDPRIKGVVTITAVETSSDLRVAKVHVSVMGSPEDRESVLQGLRAASAYLRRALADETALRRVPELVFLADMSIQEGDRVLSLLRRVRESESGSG